MSMFGTVACICGNSGLPKEDRDSVPLMYNLGDGPRYVGACCYDTFNFNDVVQKRAFERTARERARKELKHGKDRK